MRAFPTDRDAHECVGPALVIIRVVVLPVPEPHAEQARECARCSAECPWLQQEAGVVLQKLLLVMCVEGSAISKMIRQHMSIRVCYEG